MDEDYVGRVARISRRTHSLTTCVRSFARSLMKYKRIFERKWEKTEHPSCFCIEATASAAVEVYMLGTGGGWWVGVERKS